MGTENRAEPPPLPGKRSGVMPPPLPGVPGAAAGTGPAREEERRLAPPPVVERHQARPAAGAPRAAAKPEQGRRRKFLLLGCVLVALGAVGTTGYVMYQRDLTMKALEAESRRAKAAAEQAEAARRALEEKVQQAAAAAEEEKRKRLAIEEEAQRQRESAEKEAADKLAAEDQARVERERAAAAQRASRAPLMNGAWTGSYQCGPHLLGASNTAPFSARASMSIRDGAIQLTRSSSQPPAYEERLTGRLKPDLSFQLSGGGSYVKGGDWTTSFVGRLLPGENHRAQGTGQIFDRKGQKVRDCRLSLDRQ